VWRIEGGGAESLVFEKTYGTADHPTFESVITDLYKAGP